MIFFFKTKLKLFFRILKIESEFYKHVDLQQSCRKLGMESDSVDCLYRYWILKRRSVANRPLFIPLIDDHEAANTTSLSPSEDNQREKLKKLVALRQDLERVSAAILSEKSTVY